MPFDRLVLKCVLDASISMAYIVLCVSERWCEVMSKHFMNITVWLVSYLYVYTCVYVCVCGTSKLRQWYDVIGRGSSNDILSTAGFLTALRDVLRLAKGALLWIGLPCSSCLGLVCIYLCEYICVCEYIPVQYM